MPDITDWIGMGRKNANTFIRNAKQNAKVAGDLILERKIKRRSLEIKKVLVYFFDIFNKQRLINVHQVKTPNIDTILTLFIRVNSGGVGFVQNRFAFFNNYSKMERC